jgi:pyridinium-3,5-biscarboxylic acid mononucleotide sulfurtransferase
MSVKKEQHLRELLLGMGSCIVAYSGGVDSAYLAVVAHQTLSRRSLAVTAVSPSYPTYQRQTALDIVQQFGLHHELVASREMDDANYVANPSNRCYFCKHDLYSRLQLLAVDRGFHWIVDGNNLDDTGDYRPGRQAGRELEVRSPLIEVGLHKDEIRELSRRLGIPNWDQPASACLSSRIPYGSAVTSEKLRMIDRGEDVLRVMGFSQSRVRHHGDVARIEIARGELPNVLRLEVFERLSREFKTIGFKFVTVDVDGYRTGALNEVLTQIETHSR